MVPADHHAKTVLSRLFTRKTRRRHLRLVLILALVIPAACAQPLTPQASATLPASPTQPRTLTRTLAPTNTLPPSATSTPQPTLTPTIPTDTVVERGTLPPGFSLTVYGQVYRPTSLAFGPDGWLYAASADGNVYALADNDDDHRAETRTIYASTFSVPLGLLWIGDDLYISYTGSVVLVQDTDANGVSDKVVSIVVGLPTGRHQNDGLVLGSDSYIYMGLGSTCDACNERSQYSASILRFKPDGTGLSIVASGFRNPYDLAFNSAGDLFATDNGRDELGDDLPPEELNYVTQGGFYGWPDCWEEALVPIALPVPTLAARCVNQSHAVARFAAHSSADGLVIYNGDNFPPRFKDNAFVAIFGSYILPEIERGIMRIQLTKDGTGYQGQADWFLQLGATGRPLDLTVGPDGGLYVGDYEANAVYRIVYGKP